MTEGKKKKSKPYSCPGSHPRPLTKPSWRDQSPSHYTHAHTHCMFGALKHCLLTYIFQGLVLTGLPSSIQRKGPSPLSHPEQDDDSGGGGEGE